MTYFSHETIYLIYSILPAIIACIGTSIGQGMIGASAVEAINRQPFSSAQILRVTIIGTAITETAAIFGLVMSILLLNKNFIATEYNCLASLGITCAIGLSSFFAGFAASFPVQATIQSIAQQPSYNNKYLNMMLITQTLIMTPNVFGLIISLLIKNELESVDSFNKAMQLFSSGLSIGLGCIGPCIGMALFAKAACTAVGFNKWSFPKIMPFTFICQAIIETPVILSLLIGLMILSSSISLDNNVQAWQFLAAALSIAISTIAPGINSGKTAAHACKQISLYHEQYSSIFKLTMLALAMIDSFAIYGLLISIIILLAF